MKLKVLKFGGTSVGSKEAIIRSASIISKWSKKYKKSIVLHTNIEKNGFCKKKIEFAGSINASVPT